MEKKDVIDVLLKNICNEYSYVRCNSVKVLLELGNRSDEVIRALIKSISDSCHEVRCWSALALGKLGNNSDEVISALEEYALGELRNKNIAKGI